MVFGRAGRLPAPLGNRKVVSFAPLHRLEKQGSGRRRHWSRFVQPVSGRGASPTVVVNYLIFLPPFSAFLFSFNTFLISINCCIRACVKH